MGKLHGLMLITLLINLLFSKIIAPESYIDSFIDRLDEIKRTYQKTTADH